MHITSNVKLDLCKCNSTNSSDFGQVQLDLSKCDSTCSGVTQLHQTVCSAACYNLNNIQVHQQVISTITLQNIITRLQNN